MLAFEMLTPIAVTEKAEVGTGWRRGSRRLGRHAFITFGYQPKASGKDTCLGHVPGARIYLLPKIGIYIYIK